MRLAIEDRLVEKNNRGRDTSMGRACQLGSPCGGIHGKQKRDHTKHRASKMRSNSCVMSSQTRRVMHVRGSRLREEHADNRRDLKGSTVNILLLFLEIIPDNSRSKFCIFCCPRVLLHFIKFLQSSSGNIDFNVYIWVFNAALATHFFSCV